MEQIKTEEEKGGRERQECEKEDEKGSGGP